MKDRAATQSLTGDHALLVLSTWVHLGRWSGDPSGTLRFQFPGLFKIIGRNFPSCAILNFFSIVSSVCKHCGFNQ